MAIDDTKRKHFAHIRETTVPEHVHLRKANDAAQLDPENRLNQIKSFNERFPAIPPQPTKHPAFEVNLQGKAPELAGSVSATDWQYHKKQLANAREREVEKRVSLREQDTRELARNHIERARKADAIRSAFYFARQKTNMLEQTEAIKKEHYKVRDERYDNFLYRIQHMDERKFAAYLRMWMRELAPAKHRFKQRAWEAVFVDTWTEHRIKQASVPNGLQRLVMETMALQPLMRKYKLYDMFVQLLNASMQQTDDHTRFANYKHQITVLFAQLFKQARIDQSDQAYEDIDRHFDKEQRQAEVEAAWGHIKKERALYQVEHLAQIDFNKALYWEWVKDYKNAEHFYAKQDETKDRSERHHDYREQILPMTFDGRTAHVKNDPASRLSKLGLIAFWNEGYRQALEKTQMFNQLAEQDLLSRQESDPKHPNFLGTSIIHQDLSKRVRIEHYEDAMIMKKLSHYAAMKHEMFYRPLDEITKMFAAQAAMNQQTFQTKLEPSPADPRDVSLKTALAPAVASGGGKKVG